MFREPQTRREGRLFFGREDQPRFQVVQARFQAGRVLMRVPRGGTRPAEYGRNSDALAGPLTVRN